MGFILINQPGRLPLANHTMRQIHPGEILREEVIAANDLSITETAKLLGISRQSLNNIIHQKSNITPKWLFELQKYLAERLLFEQTCKLTITCIWRQKKLKSLI